MKNLTKAEIETLRTALALLNSMVRGGETHSKQSEEVVRKAFKLL